MNYITTTRSFLAQDVPRKNNQSQYKKMQYLQGKSLHHKTIQSYKI